MKKTLFILTSLLLTASCSMKQKQDWGLANEAPDEFMVSTRAPLTLPPDYSRRPVNSNMQINPDNIKYQDFSDEQKAFLKKVENNDIEKDINKELSDIKSEDNSLLVDDDTGYRYEPEDGTGYTYEPDDGSGYTYEE